jgi:hypothetical protein
MKNDYKCKPIKATKNVYFLGAGASAYGNVPTLFKFDKKAEKVLNDIISQREGRDLVQNVLNHWKRHFDDYNIEEYFSVIEMEEQLGYKGSITAENIASFIGLTIDNTRKMLNTLSYKKLIENGCAEAIITTNWDFLLERSVTELQDRLFDKNAPINYDGTIEPYYSVTEQAGYPPPILKIHGSLNWGYCEKCGQIYYFNRPIYKVLYSDDVPCKKHSSVKLTPFIVPPTLSKLKLTTEKSPYVQLASVWRKAYGYLKSCEKLFFIGYSFPETDVQMKYFISSALRNNPNLKEIIVVTKKKDDENKKRDFEERYHSVLSKTPINPNFIYDGFEGFCEKNLPGLQ